MPQLLAMMLLTTLWEPSPSVTEEKVDNDALVRTVIMQNDAAYRRITAYTIEQEWKSFEPYRPGDDEAPVPEDITNIGWMRAVVMGDYLLVNRKEQRSTPSGKGDHAIHYQAVLNDNYFAYYMGQPVNSITLLEHASIARMRGRQPDRIKSDLDPPALKYAFGDGNSTLRSLYEKSKGYSTWRIHNEPLDGEPVYRIVWVTEAKDGKQWRSHFLVDPKRDFLLRRIEHLNKEGQPRITCEIELQLIDESKTWIPKSVHVKEYDETKIEMWLDVKHVTIGPPKDSSVFSIASFELPSETRMRRFTRGARIAVNYRYHNGIWQAE